MKKRYVYSLSKRRLGAKVGSKAANIHFLLRHGIKVPGSWVILWTAYEDDLRDRETTLMALREELNAILEPQKRYAVRSSASVEDSSEFSCAGLFKSYLQVQGIEATLDRVTDVWASLESPEFTAYRQHHMASERTPRMAVILQEMVQPQFSGVVFTKNPVTGFSEVIIEAGLGTGEDQVQSRGDPERWISKWGNWVETPEDAGLSDTLARTIVVQAKEIARKYRRPVDLEWAWDGETLYFLQVRPITRLDIPVYSNRIARDMLPGIIKPLVWSVNTRLINPVWATILGRLTGERSWAPDTFTGHYYYRAYFNMGVFGRVFERLGMPAEALELLFGLEEDGPEKPEMRPGPGALVRLPGLLFFTMGLVGIHSRLYRLTRRKRPAYERLALQMEEEQSPAERLQWASQVFDETKEVAYYNIIIPLMAMMYHRLLSRLLKKHGYDVRSLELKGAREAAARYNPQYALNALHDRFFGEVDTEKGGTFLAPEREEELEQEIHRFLEAFGHLSDSGNDCSSIPWRERPDLVRRMIERQQGVGGDREMVDFEELKIPWSHRLLIGFVYRRASRFAVDREEISSLYTYGYGQFRTCFVKLGEELVKQNLIDDREDIYYLYWRELTALIGDGPALPQQDLVAARRKDIAFYRDATLPELILGEAQPPLIADERGDLHGIPTSLGTYSGPARVIQGIEDFEKILEGDVLVIPFADVGWTPLFARAGAVVSESGGMLSHASIVAREYRIPAVVSVAGACRLQDGLRITVNGYSGDIAFSTEGRRDQ